MQVEKIDLSNQHNDFEKALEKFTNKEVYYIF